MTPVGLGRPPDDDASTKRGAASPTDATDPKWTARRLRPDLCPSAECCPDDACRYLDWRLNGGGPG